MMRSSSAWSNLLKGHEKRSNPGLAFESFETFEQLAQGTIRLSDDLLSRSVCGDRSTEMPSIGSNAFADDSRKFSSPGIDKPVTNLI